MRFLLVMAILFGAIPAHADWASKLAALTCDEQNNQAMIRLQVVGNSTDPNNVVGPDLSDPKLKKYNLLNMAKKPVTNDCTLSDGRHLEVSYGEGQAFAYGQGGGDPNGWFSLQINGKPAFYKKNWYSGYGSYNTDPILVILDKSQLISCKGSENFNDAYNPQNFRLGWKNCHDVSERLKGELQKDESAELKKDKEEANYLPIIKNKKVCNFVADEKNLTLRNNDLYAEAEKIDSVSRRTDDRPAYFGAVSKFSINLLKNGRAQDVYRIFASNHYFDGDYLVYFSDLSHEKDFLSCVTSGVCPSFKDADIEDFVEHAETIWPGIHVISSPSLPNSVADYDICYTHINPVIIDEKTYFVFSPLNTKKFPAAVVGELNKDGVISPICTYRERLSRW